MGAEDTTGLVTGTTEYVVLGVYENDWTIVSTVAARDGNAAIKAAVTKRDSIPPRIRNTDVFVAVPVRSWKPVQVTEKVERTLVLDEVKS